MQKLPGTQTLAFQNFFAGRRLLPRRGDACGRPNALPYDKNNRCLRTPSPPLYSLSTFIALREIVFPEDAPPPLYSIRYLRSPRVSQPSFPEDAVDASVLPHFA